MGGRQQEISQAFAQRKSAAPLRNKSGKAATKVSHEVPLKAQNQQQPTEPQVHVEDADLGDDMEMEKSLKAWDMDMKFGPCIGMTRLQRWERAKRNGLSPPEHVRDFLVHGGASPHCLWENRV